MSCPTCSYTMQGLDGEGDLYWCPRCGTLKYTNDRDAISTPKLVERCLLMSQNRAKYVITKAKGPAEQALDGLVAVGDQMSNICCNLSQPSWRLCDRDRKVMWRLFHEWDDASRKLNEACRFGRKPQKAAAGN